MPAVRSGTPVAATEAPASGDSSTGGRHWVKAVVQVLVKLAYPALILCAWRWDTPRYVGCMLFAILWLQRWAGSGPVATSLRRLSGIDWTVVGLLSCASAAIVWTNSELLLRLYPSLVNLGLLIAFGATLVHGPSMIEKFARLGNPDLPPGAVRHTRRVTQVWCVFFLLNGAFSAYTALYWSRASWSLYNGAIAYVLIGVLLIAEVIWRYLVVLPRAARSEAA
ncbi:COG4648 family protein [Paraburkholderia strydomiana]|uniref:COG4648 family protein n=1 Tax=Paraburkholderia strydomiana TaxID=1245417 RepID=UPI0038B8E9B1